MARRYTPPPTDDLTNFTITDPASSTAVAVTVVDNYGSVLITTTGASNAQTIANPTDTEKTKRFTVINNDTSTNSIAVNGVTIEAGEAEQYVWDGTVWLVDGVGGGSGAFSTTSNVTSNAPGTLATDDFVFGSDSLDDDGNSDHDSRMFFDKSKGAFRAGKTISTEWDEASVGDYSASFGYGTGCSGSYSFSAGIYANATGAYSSAFGYSATSSGDNSFAVGQSVTTSGDSSASSGKGFRNAQDYSLAVGYGTGDTNDAGAAIRLEADPDQDDSKKASIYMRQTTAPSTTTDRLYNVGGNPYFDGNPLNNVVATKTSDYTASTENVILADATSADVTITLPAVSGLSGRTYTINKTDVSANSVIVEGNGAETIDGELNIEMITQYDSLTVVTDGTEWFSM